MKRVLLFVLLCLFATQLQAQTRRARPLAVVDRTTTLPIRRVILYSNGVAYIERRGTNQHESFHLNLLDKESDEY